MKRTSALIVVSSGGGPFQLDVERVLHDARHVEVEDPAGWRNVRLGRNSLAHKEAGAGAVTFERRRRNGRFVGHLLTAAVVVGSNCTNRNS